jgi:hypothetical protein
MPEILGQENVSERSLRDIYYMLLRHKWKMIALFLGIIAAVTAYVMLWIPRR